MSDARSPEAITIQLHGDYYSRGSYPDDRIRWTVQTFFSGHPVGRVLEVGCGDGALLELLRQEGYSVDGVDASSTGIQHCKERGVRATCIDASTRGLPFSDGEFDHVVSLETFEHLMNPYFVLQEVRRVLKPGGRFVCSIPNPLTGHPYLYPGLFEYWNYRRFLEQSGFSILSVAPWQWAPRETILPRFFRRYPPLRSRYFAGLLRRTIERAYLVVGKFPWFCYWLWTFECSQEKLNNSIFETIASATRPRGKA